jgi:hypothetical protein
LHILKWHPTRALQRFKTSGPGFVCSRHGQRQRNFGEESSQDFTFESHFLLRSGFPLELGINERLSRLSRKVGLLQLIYLPQAQRKRSKGSEASIQHSRPCRQIFDFIERRAVLSSNRTYRKHHRSSESHLPCAAECVYARALRTDLPRLRPGLRT